MSGESNCFASLVLVTFLYFSAAKDVKKSTKVTKKPAAAAAAPKKQTKPAAKTKPMQKAAPRVGGKR